MIPARRLAPRGSPRPDQDPRRPTVPGPVGRLRPAAGERIRPDSPIRRRPVSVRAGSPADRRGADSGSGPDPSRGDVGRRTGRIGRPNRRSGQATKRPGWPRANRDRAISACRDRFWSRGLGIAPGQVLSNDSARRYTADGSGPRRRAGPGSPGPWARSAGSSRTSSAATGRRPSGSCPWSTTSCAGSPRRCWPTRRPGQTLQATALVHEAYLRLVGDDPGKPWDGRRHFFAAAAEAMRRILIDRARDRRRQKRGGGRRRVRIDLDALLVEPPGDGSAGTWTRP